VRRATAGLVRMGMGPRRKQSKQCDRHEVAKRGFRPMDERPTVREPGWVDQEDDACDHDLPEPADDEKQRREHDPPEAELGQADRVREVEHVPGKPEDEWRKQDHHREHYSRDRETSGDERPDPEDTQNGAESRMHAESLRGLEPLPRVRCRDLDELRSTDRVRADHCNA
jgi:hypothetical protein